MKSTRLLLAAFSLFFAPFAAMGQFFPGNTALFAAPSISALEIDGSPTAMAHLRVGAGTHANLTAGFYAAGSVNEIRPVREQTPDIYMDYRSYGGFMEFTPFSQRRVHLTIPVAIGLSEIEMDSDAGEPGLGEAHFWQFEPAVLLEINMNDYVRLNLGVSYRLVDEFQYRHLTAEDFEVLTAKAGLRIGLFPN